VDSRPTVAFYAGLAQYESFFEAHGFRDEARRLQKLAREREILSHGDLVPDEMVRTFVICGKPDVVRARVERAWTVADSLCLVPPAYNLPPRSCCTTPRRQRSSSMAICHNAPTRSQKEAWSACPSIRRVRKRHDGMRRPDGMKPLGMGLG
jgi:hypothetical protein